jgi:hypothetical protein
MKWNEAKSISFFKLAATLGSNLPFKRMLSLMRLLKCEEYSLEKSTWGKDCSHSICGERYNSCQDYAKNLFHYDVILENKICNRFFFRRTSHGEKQIIGYCIVHKDRLRDSKGEIKDHFYLTECIIANPNRAIKGYAYGNYKTQVPFNGDKLTITGNYFSQQNGFTNCCAQAAIKMVLRGYFNNITCEEINRVAGIRHERQEGKIGFRASQTCAAIERYSKEISDCELTPSMLIADSADLGHFLKNIYHAIESKIPVILFMVLPKQSQVDQTKGHAVSLIGHSFEMNNWGAYGGGYFSEKTVGYLSSFLWCGSFIIQDDNFGPFYQLSTKFLREYTDLYRRQLSFSDCAMKRLPLRKDESSQQPPLSAVLIHKKEHSYIPQSYMVEEFSATLINHFLNALEAEKQLPESEAFNLFFYNYYSRFNYTNLFNNNHQNALILRTLLVSREEYRESEAWGIYCNDKVEDRVYKILPSYFWLVEISVPELYWINHGKVGEIIIDPLAFEEEGSDIDNQSEESPILIRLPDLLAIYVKDQEIEEGNFKYFKIGLTSNNPHQKLLKKRKGFLRTTCGKDSE